MSKEVTAEVIWLVKHFNTKTPIEPVAISLAVIFLPLVLQKLAPRMKNADHIRYLKKCLSMWKKGKIKELLLEGAEIQKRFMSSKRKEEALSS